MAGDEFMFYELRRGLWAKEEEYGIGKSESFRYSSFFGFTRILDSIGLPEKPYSSSTYRPPPPVMYFRQEHEWFKLTLCLPLGWKDDAAKQFPNAAIKEQRGSVIVELARIPSEYFKHMREAWEISYTERWKKRDVRWDGVLRSLGWEPDGTSVTRSYISISVHEI
jgi:hypothetical protein